MNAGAIALKAWLDRLGKTAFDALWRACGIGAINATAMCAGELVPDAGLAEDLARVTQGAVTIDMFDVPVEAPVDRAA